mmetsp:Transcript_4314/g.8726  ORF Transcript_4314/g.8726 Transcript_4314/m.8726 type:complete len:95 (-) Transcript_4314:206-490(-)
MTFGSSPRVPLPPTVPCKIKDGGIIAIGVNSRRRRASEFGMIHVAGIPQPRGGFVDGTKFSFGRGVWSNINHSIFRETGSDGGSLSLGPQHSVF